ncbi:MAG: glycosylase, partial [Erysipelotrichaceae bacterium]|nr:glycosylase [Erysipelotrichaceae bacterium]
MPEWLKDTIFYEIYPQSFKDTNGDGIGDLNGIIEKLDYVKSLGANALWINPCFDSPFKDAGYDVRDYKKVAPRYGTNEDLVRLFETAHAKGIRVLLDLVPGHTSDTHEWFIQSSKYEENEYSGRYVWTTNAFEGIAGHPYISGMTERYGAYMLNFFASQPALNYGWLNRTEKWMSAVDSPEARATIEALKDIMRFWLDAGCDGFRVDMADSLVKNDDEHKSATA